MVGQAPTANQDTVVALKTTGVKVEGFEDQQTFTPEEMGVRPLARLQIPTQMGLASETCKVLMDLIDDINNLRRLNLRQSWQYSLRLQRLISVANKRLALHAKSGGER